MSELLSKEKQFLKINEQLDKMALTASNQDRNTNNTASTVGKSIKSDGRYLTYQKNKGQSTFLRKQGAGGDGFVEVVENTKAIATNKISTGGGGGGGGAANGGGGETFRSTKRSNDTCTSPRNSRLKPTKFSEASNSQTQSRISSRSVVPANTFTIKYRNAKFVESPSLEILVKDESSALRCQKDLDSFRIGSVKSLPVDDCHSIASGRRSQTGSNATVNSRKNLSSEGLIKFLKSKIVILEEDHQRIALEMKKQKELLEKTLERTKIIEQQRDQAIAKSQSLSEQLAKNDKHLEDANKHLKDRSIDISALQKELETTKRELKILTQSNNNLEKRLFRSNEELEIARNTISAMKTNDREQKESVRLELEAKDKQVKSLKKQRADLLNAYKKQLFLIDNLKRQNVCLEQAKLISMSEKEFTKLLDWDIKN